MAGGAWSELWKLEGHAADLRPTSGRPPRRLMVKTLPRSVVWGRRGESCLRGAGKFMTLIKVASSAGMCSSRFFEARIGAGKRRGGREDKLIFLHK